MVKTSPIPRHWVPAPARTSPSKQNDKIKKIQGVKSGADIDRVDKDSSPQNRTEFTEKLEELLAEVRQMKENISQPVDHRNSTGGEVDKLLADSKRAIESVESTLSKALRDVNISRKERDILQKSLDVVKDELAKSVTEKNILSEHHTVLIDKLRRVEDDATSAVRHVSSLRELIQKLSREGISNLCEGHFEREKRQEMLSKLSRLDDANNSLQNLIRGMAVEDQPELPQADNEFPAEKRPEVLRLVSEIKVLHERLQSDHREILKLRAAVMELTSRSENERRTFQNEISGHREAANKYLSVVDSVKIQLSEKNSEMNTLRTDINSLRLHNASLLNENETLRAENSSLQSNVKFAETALKGEEANLRSRLDELATKFSQVSTRATLLEVENEKLKLTLAGSQDLVARQKLDVERLSKELQGVSGWNRTALSQIINSKMNKSVQTDVSPSVSESNKDSVDHKNLPNAEEIDENKWIKVVELWQIVQNEKAAIMQQLKDLEAKLEKSEVANLEFKKELNKKEESMRTNDFKLQEKIVESNSLKEMLEAALKDLRKFGEEAKKNAVSLDHVTQAKLNDLDKLSQQYKNESEQSKRQKDQLERKLTVQIEELQGRLEALQKTNRNMQEYITFLRTSYASVFGDGSLATTNYPF